MKKTISLLLCLVLVLSLCACTQQSAPEESATGLKTFTVTVVHADGSEKVFTYETEETYVGPVVLSDGLVKGNDGPYGLEITEVDGEKAVYATDGAYWAIYENDQYATSGIDGIKITDGGQYTLKYEKG